MAKRLIVCIDNQVDFNDLPGSKLPVPGSAAKIEPTNKYLSRLRHSEIAGVMFTQDWHDADWVEYMPDGTPFPSHCVKDTEGARLAVQAMSVPRPIPLFGLRKNVFDMFAETDLKVIAVDRVTEIDIEAGRYGPTGRDAWFAAWQERGVNTVEVFGHALNICAAFGVRGLVDRGFKVIVNAALSQGLDLGGGENDTVAENVFRDLITSGNVSVI